MRLHTPHCHLENGPAKVPETNIQKLMKGQRKVKLNINKYVQDKHDFRGRTSNLLYKVIFFKKLEQGLCLLPNRPVFHSNSDLMVSYLLRQLYCQ